MAALDWLSDWDDLVHGTVVFSAAIPFAIGLLIAWKLPPNVWWLGVLVAVIGPFLWLFGLPAIIPGSSEDVALLSVVIAAIVFALSPKLKWPITIVVGVFLFGWMQWCVYPAWLAENGGLAKKLLVCGSVVGSMVVLGMCAEVAVASGASGRTTEKCRCSRSALIAPTIGLAILLQLGGAARFGQATGAIATVLGTLCLYDFVKNREVVAAMVPALWGLFFALLAWSGWLFADVRYGLAAALCFAPIAGLVTHFLPLPRKSERQNQLWDGLASAVVASAIVGIAVSDYLADASEFEGY